MSESVAFTTEDAKEARELLDSELAAGEGLMGLFKTFRLGGFSEEQALKLVAYTLVARASQ